MKKVNIVIVHFGDPRITIGCIEGIFNKLNFDKLIVVDNSQNFTTKRKKVLVIRSKQNLGFAAGVNVGIQKSLEEKADYILLINNDTNITSDFLNPIINLAEIDVKTGIVGPAIKFRKDGRYVYDLGGKVNKLFGRTSHMEVSKIANKEAKAVGYVSGCAMLIKSEVFKKIGLFDKKFFLYYEDVDFCLRARRAGFKTYVLPSAYIEHALSKSVGKNSEIALYNQTKSGLIFGKKHFSRNLIINRIFLILQSMKILINNPDKFRFLLALKYI